MPSAKQQVLDFLNASPPRLTRTVCELCDSPWLMTIANHDRYGLPVRFAMCRRCGLVALNPRWDQAAYNRFYTDHYHPLLRESGITIAFGNWQEYFQKMEQATDLRHRLPRGGRVLELGGGEGWLAEYLRDQYAAQVTIVEPNAHEAERAAAKGFEVHPRVFEECRFDEASFDLVVLMRTVDHLIDASLTFERLRCLLKPGGLVILDGVDYFRRMAVRRSAIAPLKIDHCYYFSPETLPALLQRAGLQPLVTDLVAIPGQIVVLAQCAEAPINGRVWLSGEQRYLEWERLANRPVPVTQSPPLAHVMRSELSWLGSRVRKRLQGGHGR